MEITDIIELHIKALCCHCECLGMNSANMMSIIKNESPVYDDSHYIDRLTHWGLIDSNGDPMFDCKT